MAPSLPDTALRTQVSSRPSKHYLRRPEAKIRTGRAGVLGEEMTNGFSVVTSISKDTINRQKKKAGIS